MYYVCLLQITVIFQDELFGYQKALHESEAYF